MSDARTAAIDPFYFESGDGRLFGCYHAAEPPIRDCAFVFCNARGHEYVQFHRVYRQLAILLAEAGFPVLRFDLSGTGDSSGDDARWRLARWVDDVNAAIAELRSRVTVPRTALVGLRLGGTLALLAAGARDDIDATVLWDPVLRGSEYLAELDEVHQRMLGFAHVVPKRPVAGAGPEPERLGFPLPPELASDLRGVDVLGGLAAPAKRALVIESHTTVSQEPLRAALEKLGVATSYQRFENRNLWAWVEDFAKVHVPHRILEAIVDWSSEEYA